MFLACSATRVMLPPIHLARHYQRPTVPLAVCLTRPLSSSMVSRLLFVACLTLNSGQGMMVEGPIVELRHHTLLDSNNKYHRYLAIVVDVLWGHNRTFDAQGREIETEQSTIDRIRIGYAKVLNLVVQYCCIDSTSNSVWHYIHQWETVVKADPNALSPQQIVTRLKGVGIPLEWYAEGASKLHPTIKNRVEFWADRQILIHGKLKVGETVKIKVRYFLLLLD
jgi:hypothetical protein